MEKQTIFDYISGELLTFIGLIGSNFATWFFTRKKQKAETNSVEITNLDSTFSFYKTIITDLEARIDRLQSKLDDMEEQIHRLEEENLNLRLELKKYKSHT